MTFSEKVLAIHSKKEKVKAGDFVIAKCDLMYANDVTAPLAINYFNELGFKNIRNLEKIVLIADHFVPNKDINSAQQVKLVRDFAKKNKIKNYYECEGICHTLITEKGFVRPGDLVIGADSHTCTCGALGAFSVGVGSTDVACSWATGECWFKVPETIKFKLKGKLKKWTCGKDIILYIIGKIGVNGANYCMMEFECSGEEQLSLSDKFTISNMAIEAGAKSAVFYPDKQVFEFLNMKNLNPKDIIWSDDTAEYKKIFELDISDLEPLVAVPYSPENVKSVSEIKGIKVDQVVIGSCTNGRIEDLRIAAKIIKNHKVSKWVRLLIFPATQKIYLSALKEGLIESFIESGATICPPTCGPCLGGHLGVLADNEIAISTTNRNFIARMGHKTSKVYLSSPAVAASSAIAGEIIHPKEIV